MAYQSAARELTLSNPTITGGTITGATVDGFVGTAGAGNLTAYKLCYYDSGTGTLLHAKADAIATSRKIMGVTTAAATAAASATLKRRGYARITADGACSPVIGAEAYLSGATAGCVASAIIGAYYPRQVGYFLEGSVAGDGTVLVELALDDSRDDNRDWAIESWAASGVTLTKKFTFNPLFFRELWLKVDGVRSDNATSGGALLRTDNASGACAIAKTTYRETYNALNYEGIGMDTPFNGVNDLDAIVATHAAAVGTLQHDGGMDIRLKWTGHHWVGQSIFGDTQSPTFGHREISLGAFTASLDLWVGDWNLGNGRMDTGTTAVLSGKVRTPLL